MYENMFHVMPLIHMYMLLTTGSLTGMAALQIMYPVMFCVPGRAVELCSDV